MADRESIARRLSLEGKTAMVTGAGGGIGSSIASVLLAAGARVASVDLPGKPCVEEAVALPCDLGSPSSVRDLFERFGERFERLDVLVHAAGITRDGVLWKMDDDAWDDVLRVNLDTAFWLVREATPWFRRGDGGSVVLISSINGERGKFGQANYAASKAGLIGFGKTAARELGRFGVRVNLVAPGLIETAMTAAIPEEARRKALEETALGRFGRPEDVAGAVLFLASPMSGHVTGQVLRVDGGQLM